MPAFNTLPPAEHARQLANPDGPVGVEVAEWLNGNNRESNARLLAMLGVQAGDHVLEIGFGNGRAARDIIGQAINVRYAGIDISPTMVDEANRFNTTLVATGQARFHLASAEHMPFADASFDRAFAIGVIHFWSEPLRPLQEVQRVLRSGGIAVMGALDVRDPPEFARPEFGFFLRTAADWAGLCHQAGFIDVDAQNVESQQLTPGGLPIRRYAVRLTVRR